MRLRALIALPALLGLGACVDPYYDGYNGGYGSSYGPTGYVSGSYYGSSAPTPYYYNDRRDYDRRDSRPRYDARPDYRPPDRQTEYRPRPPEREPAYRPGNPGGGSGSPHGRPPPADWQRNGPMAGE
ncbi:hypothetical protein EDC65_4302 [Stella humosa]|uniref:Lipoprotein n=1 Tax=Stella humosa TaxID=94 RepID=A0A3N1KPH8_9PROT|nr:hypothetical protein [Stella humosa]ROP83653.1 hypothetical protein EDC65_4302 [Stella humosa]BBK33074.1 hypothetical protein STHU_37080 [Stella humosa]